MNGEGSLLAPDISLFPTLRYLHSDFTSLLLFFFFLPFHSIDRRVFRVCVRRDSPLHAVEKSSIVLFHRARLVDTTPPPLSSPKPLVVCDLHSLGLSDRKPGIRAALN